MRSIAAGFACAAVSQRRVSRLAIALGYAAPEVDEDLSRWFRKVIQCIEAPLPLLRATAEFSTFKALLLSATKASSGEAARRRLAIPDYFLADSNPVRDCR
jgi:hypothetical protein